MKTNKKGIHSQAAAFASGGSYKIHDLKSWPEHFNKVKSREKTFEFRRNDRDFNVGDFIMLMEYIPEGREFARGGVILISTGEYTGEWVRMRITDIFSPGNGGELATHLDPWYAILSFKIEDEGTISGGKAIQERLI